MSKRILSVLTAVGLVAGALISASSARAQEGPPVDTPEVVQIEDPYGDANMLGGDQVTPADGGSVSDIGKVWFGHDETNLYVYWLTEGPRGANTVGLQFVLLAGENGCLTFDGISTGVTYPSPDLGRVTDACNGLDRTEVPFTMVEAPGGEGLAILTVPRSYSPAFANGSTITAPTAQSWIFAGAQEITPTGYRGVRQEVDDTKVGTDYVLSGGDNVVQPKPDKPKPPGKDNPPGKGKKKGCAKGKGKKKGACPQPEPKACAPFEPGDLGKDQPSVVLTDAATEAAPVEHAVSLDASVANYNVVGGPTATGPGASHASFFNVQVDSDKPDVGLYALVEFPERRDYDLNVFHPDGSYAARSRGNNTFIGTPAEGNVSAPGHAGNPTTSSENIVGVKTSDCGGWTMDMESWFAEGGDFTVKLWLGEIKNDPQPAGAETP